MEPYKWPITDIPTQEKQPEKSQEDPKKQEEKDEYYERPHFKPLPGAKLPPRLRFEFGVQRHSKPYRLSDDVTFDGNTIRVYYPNKIFTIKGKALDDLFDFLCREKVEIVREIEPIDSIEVEDRE